jgi:hypothetical protein
MSEILDNNLIAWWGAVLSTVLALVKLWELWRDRFRIDVSYNFTGHEDMGNQIFIRNLSSKPIILEYWTIYYSKGMWPFRKLSLIESLGEDIHDTRIDTHSSMTMNFTGQNHFAWGDNVLKGRKIYIQLYIAGKRPIFKKVY